MKTILVPITHTLNPKFLEHTKQLATENNAKLIILYISSPLTLSNCYSYPSMLYSISNINMETIQAAHDSLAYQIDTILSDFDHETICLVGPTTDTILKVAESKKVDMIVIPESGSPKGGKFMVKPKSHALSKKTAIPVVVYDDKA